MNAISLSNISCELKSKYEELKIYNENPIMSLYRNIHSEYESSWPDFALESIDKKKELITFIHNGKRYRFNGQISEVNEIR